MNWIIAIVLIIGWATIAAACRSGLDAFFVETEDAKLEQDEKVTE